MVDEAALSDMDRLERISEADGYRRVQIAVNSEPGNEEIQVFAYVKPPQQLQDMQVRLGPIAEYELKHSSLYQKRKP